LDKDARRVASWDAIGNPIVSHAEGNPLVHVGGIFERSATDRPAGFAFVDRHGNTIPLGGGLENIPYRESAVKAGAPWARGGAVRTAPAYDALLYHAARPEIFRNLAELYARYDALVAEFPGYVSRQTLGIDGFGNPLHQYTFSAPTLTRNGWSEAETNPPKILILSGVHGGERVAQTGLLIFANNLCKHWRSMEHYGRFRFSARFVLIPAGSPSAVDAGTRRNRNGVDVNRNFDWRWGEGSSDPASENYRGVAPASEPETAILSSLPTLHADAEAFVDMHNHALPEAIWIGTRRAESLALGLAVAQKATEFLRSEISFGQDPDTSVAFVAKNSGGTCAGYLQEVGGMRGMLVETPGAQAHPQLDGSAFSVRRLSEFCTVAAVARILDRHERTRAAEPAPEPTPEPTEG